MFIIVTKFWLYKKSRWMNLPAILIGYFNRVMLPGTAFQVHSQSNGKNLSPALLDRITKIGVITTYGGSFWNSFMLGDNGRRFISNTFRTILSPNCQLVWNGVYNVETANPAELTKEISNTREAFKHF